MKKQRLTLVLLLVGIVGACLVIFSTREREPMYQGKPLSYWLKWDDHAKTEAALQHIGTNALPYLIEILRAKDGPMVKKVLDMAGNKLPFELPFDTAFQKHMYAAAGFEVLGPKAAPAIPQLGKLLESGESHIALCLAVIGDESLPFLIKGLTNSNWSVRHSTASALGYMESKAETAIPELIRALRDKNKLVQYSAADALGKIQRQPEIVIPALIEALNDTNDPVKWNAAEALGEFGIQASNAIPKLSQLAGANIRHVSDKALLALRKIDSEAAAKIGSK